MESPEIATEGEETASPPSNKNMKLNTFCHSGNLQWVQNWI